jgi:hypothetical protein
MADDPLAEVRESEYVHPAIFNYMVFDHSIENLSVALFNQYNNDNDKSTELFTLQSAVLSFGVVLMPWRTLLTPPSLNFNNSM